MIDAFVETVSTVLCGVLLVAVNTRLLGAKPQDAELGSDPQLNVRVPAKPLAGVTVRVDEAVLPWVMVRLAGLKAAEIDGGTAVMVTVCADDTSGLKLPSPP
jgi:hypothetical protein